MINDEFFFIQGERSLIYVVAIFRKEFQKVYERLNIKGLEERGESFYQDRMDKVVKLLNEKGEHSIL